MLKIGVALFGTLDEKTSAYVICEEGPTSLIAAHSRSAAAFEAVDSAVRDMVKCGPHDEATVYQVRVAEIQAKQWYRQPPKAAVQAIGACADRVYTITAR